MSASFVVLVDRNQERETTDQKDETDGFLTGVVLEIRAIRLIRGSSSTARIEGWTEWVGLVLMWRERFLNSAGGSRLAAHWVIVVEVSAQPWG